MAPETVNSVWSDVPYVQHSGTNVDESPDNDAQEPGTVQLKHAVFGQSDHLHVQHTRHQIGRSDARKPVRAGKLSSVESHLSHVCHNGTYDGNVSAKSL